MAQVAFSPRVEEHDSSSRSLHRSMMKKMKRYSALDIRNRSIDPSSPNDKFTVDKQMEQDNPWTEYLKKQQQSEKMQIKVIGRNKIAHSKLSEDCEDMESVIAQGKQQLKTETKFAEQKIKEILDVYIFNKVKQTRSKTLTKLQTLFDSKNDKLNSRLQYLSQLKKQLENEKFDENIKIEIEKLKSKKPINVNIFVINNKQTLDDAFDQIDVLDHRKKNTNKNETERMMNKILKLEKNLKDQDKIIKNLNSGHIQSLQDEIKNLEQQLKDEEANHVKLENELKQLESDLIKNKSELKQFKDEEEKLESERKKTLREQKSQQPDYDHLDFNDDLTFFCKQLIGFDKQFAEQIGSGIMDRLTQRSIYERGGICLRYSAVFKSRDLYQDIEIRLKNNINDKCLIAIKSLLQSKNEHDTEQIYNSIHKENSLEILGNILITRKNKEIDQIKQLYSKNYGIYLADEIQKFCEKNNCKSVGVFFKSLIALERREKAKINEQEVEKNVKFLLGFQASGKFDKDELMTMFAKMSEAEIKEVNKRFSARNPQRIDLVTCIQKHPKLKGKKGYILNIVVSYGLSHSEYISKYLFELGEGPKKFDRNINEITRVIIARSELDLHEIRKTFEKRNYSHPGKKMVEWIMNNGVKNSPYLTKYLIKVITKLAEAKKISTFKETSDLESPSSKKGKKKSLTSEDVKTPLEFHASQSSNTVEEKKLPIPLAPAVLTSATSTISDGDEN